MHVAVSVSVYATLHGACDHFLFAVIPRGVVQDGVDNKWVVLHEALHLEGYQNAVYLNGLRLSATV